MSATDGVRCSSIDDYKSVPTATTSNSRCLNAICAQTAVTNVVENYVKYYIKWSQCCNAPPFFLVDLCQVVVLLDRSSSNVLQWELRFDVVMAWVAFALSFSSAIYNSVLHLCDKGEKFTLILKICATPMDRSFAYLW